MSQTDASSTYLTQTNASNTYLTQTDASNTYATQTSLSSYLTTTDASNTYLTQTDASNTYQTSSGLDSAISGLGYAHTTDIPSLSGYVTETGTETISNKTIQGPLYFNDNVTVSNEGEIVIDSGTNNFQVIAITNDLDLVSNSGNIILDAGGTVYVTSATSGNEVATQGFVTGQNYITSSGQYIQSVGPEFSTAANELTLNTDGTLYVDGSNNLAVQYSTGLTVDVDGKLIVNQDTIASKNYVDAVAQGLNVKNSVAVATTANITIVGATLLLTTSIDGYTVQNGDRVLVKNQDDATTNGIYDFTPAAGYTRAADESTPAKGDFVFVENGTVNGKTGWILSNTDSFDYTWTQFSAAGEYTAGSGITISGNSISFKASDVVSGSTYISNTSGVVLDVNLSAIESQLVTDGFVKSSDITTVTRKYALDITPATPFNTNTFTVTHNLDTVDVIARVYQTYGPDNGADVEVDIKRTSNNALTVSFATAPASGETYTVVVIG